MRNSLKTNDYLPYRNDALQILQVHFKKQFVDVTICPNLHFNVKAWAIVYECAKCLDTCLSNAATAVSPSLSAITDARHLFLHKEIAPFNAFVTIHIQRVKVGMGAGHPILIWEFF